MATIKPNKTKSTLATRPVIYKNLSLDTVKVDNETRIVSGYLSSFNTLDSDLDVLIKGCYAKSLAERGPLSTTNRKIAYLYMHRMDQPIGHFTILKEDDFGLYFEAYIDKIPLGDQVLEQYKSGTLNQHSVGIKYVWDKCQWGEINGNEAFICYEVQLFEGSVVTLGANENTPFLGMKQEAFESHRNELMRDTERLLKTVDFETQYEIRKLISRHIALAETEPLQALKDQGKPQESLIDKLAKIQFTQ